MATTDHLLRNSRITLTLCIALIGCLLIAGCSPEEAITSRKVHKDRSGLSGLRNPDSPPKMAAERPKTRMVVGWFETEQSTWFFKISGPQENVSKSEQEWRPFLESVSFENDSPIWELPDGWSEGAERPMRFKTLIIGDTEPKLEVAISSLAPDQDRVLNLNRWRGQIGLSKDATDADLNEQLKPIKTENGEFLLFDQVGTGSGQMRPPFAGGGMSAAPFAGGDTPPAETKVEEKPKSDSTCIAFDTPDGWESGKTSRMVQARLVKDFGGEQAMITIIEMPAAVNEWGPNVTRWAQQVGLDDLSKEELDQATSEITVDGAKGKMVELLDVKDDADAIIAGMVKNDESAWFLKLMGKKSAVSQGRPDFDKVLDSIRFK